MSIRNWGYSKGRNIQPLELRVYPEPDRKFCGRLGITKVFALELR